MVELHFRSARGGCEQGAPSSPHVPAQSCSSGGARGKALQPPGNHWGLLRAPFLMPLAVVCGAQGCSAALAPLQDAQGRLKIIAVLGGLPTFCHLHCGEVKAEAASWGEVRNAPFVPW